MSRSLRAFLQSSIFKKQIAAVTGIILVLFIIGHLAGNLLIFAGPQALNEYAEKVLELGPFLWSFRIGLLAAFVLHVYFTIRVTQENRAATAGRYAVTNPKGDWPFSRRTMVYTGLLVFFFLFLHLFDFTFADHHGEGSVVMTGDGAMNLGLFGLVWNSFLNPLRSLVYILAVCAVGLHLSHGVQSLFQSLGVTHEHYTPLVQKGSIALGLVVAVGFSLIPIYVFIRHYTIGVGV